MNNYLQMDWLDGLLIALFFGGGIALSSFFPNWSALAIDISTGGVFFAPVLRRFVLGPPQLPPPREGVLWRIISILGLLMIFFSLPVFIASGMRFKESLEPMPDVRIEIQTRNAQLNSDLKDINSLLDAVVVPVGTPQEEIDRLQAEKKAAREQQERERVEEEVARAQTEFIRRQKESYNTGLETLLVGLLICGFGSLLLRIRYPFKRDVPTA